MPTAAAAAAHDTITVTIVCARPPRAKRQVSGTIRKSTICLQAIRLVRGSGENAVLTSVNTTYAASGQANDGTSIDSRSTTIRASQQTIDIVRRICAIAIEN